MSFAKVQRKSLSKIEYLWHCDFLLVLLSSGH
jgi:hypothetical protein